MLVAPEDCELHGGLLVSLPAAAKRGEIRSVCIRVNGPAPAGDTRCVCVHACALRRGRRTLRWSMRRPHLRHLRTTRLCPQRAATSSIVFPCSSSECSVSTTPPAASGSHGV